MDSIVWRSHGYTHKEAVAPTGKTIHKLLIYNAKEDYPNIILMSTY